MMILVSNPSFMYSSHTKRRGLTLPMSYHNSRSCRRKLPNGTVAAPNVTHLKFSRR